LDDNSKIDFDYIQKYRQGDEQAFAKLFYKYYPLVYQSLIAKGILQQDAEDKTSEIFIKLADSLIDYQFAKPFEHYLRRIVRNKIYDYFRSKQWNWYSLTVENLISDSDCVFEESEIQEIINLCLLQIRSLTRRAIIISWLEGYTRKQTAELLKFPIGTVHSNLERGKEVFKQCIKGKLK